MFLAEKEKVKCQYCGYVIVKPYPKDQLCPRCKKFLSSLFEYVDDDEIKEEKKPVPKNFETKKITVATKFQGKVKVKRDKYKLTIDGDKIWLKENKEYIKLCGITSVKRTPLFCSNDRFIYLLELTNNLDFIATSILGGELDKMLLISENGTKEKCQFFVEDGIIYIAYGVFPDKKGKWILEQMSNYYSDLVRGKDVDNLNKLEKYEINKKFQGQLNYILKEYLNLQDVFSDQEIPYLEDKLRIDYLGLSSRSIGIISLLIGSEITVELPDKYENPLEELEMKESALTAKIEAIAANTLGNTQAFPRWIAVKLSFQHYRFLTFKKYPNDYFLYLLSDGNLEKLEVVEKVLNPYIEPLVSKPFSGTLRPFNELKMNLKKLFERKRYFS
ncbi:MAG: hypothetical protein ACTSRH_03555 [Promethearchaeota archaeon]